ncbi:hypothetical protein Mmc1_2977 [Magnetococcus marinus MC-1]|uniref:TPR repeat-containing protein n=2 Tax=Magnetococcus TaxID=162171 RepID=A0LBX5_MAGMM|nr:hypothetical protein Mmc1_2977 [Magnetococcus marinus MC-1]
MTGLPLVSQSAPHAQSTLTTPPPHGPKQLLWRAPQRLSNNPLLVDERQSPQVPPISLEKALQRPIFNVPEGGPQLVSLIDERQGRRIDFPTTLPSYYSWIQEMMQQPVATVEMTLLTPAPQQAEIFRETVASLADERPTGGRLLAALTLSDQQMMRPISRYAPPPRGMQRPGPSVFHDGIPTIEMVPMDAPAEGPPHALGESMQNMGIRPMDEQALSDIPVVELAQLEDPATLMEPPPQRSMALPHARAARDTEQDDIDPMPALPLGMGIPLQPMMPARGKQPEPPAQRPNPGLLQQTPPQPFRPASPSGQALPMLPSPTGSMPPVDRHDTTPAIQLQSARGATPAQPGAGQSHAQDAPLDRPPRRRSLENKLEMSASIAPATGLTPPEGRAPTHADWLNEALANMPAPPLPLGLGDGPYAEMIQQARASGQVIAAGQIESNDHAKLVLIWPEPIQFEKQVTGKEALLRFNAPFNPKDLDKALAELTGWLGDVRYGYDTLLVRASMAGTNFDVVVDGQSMIIGISRPPPEPERDERRAQTESRLRYLQTKAMREEGALYSAKARMSGLLSEDLTNTEFLAEQGNLEQDLGRWRHAVALYDRGLEQAPGEFNIIYAKANQIYTHGDWADVGQTYKNTSTSNERQVSSYSRYHHTFRHHWDMTLQAKHGSVSIDNLLRSDGTTAIRAEESWWQEALSMGYDYDHGDRAELELQHANKGGLGVTATQIWITPFSSRTTLQASYRAMYEGLALSLADGGHRSKLELSRLDFWPNSWRSIVTGSVNRYGFETDENAVESIILSGSLRYDLLQRPNQEISYTVEKEYVDEKSKAQRQDAGGNLFYLFPIDDRETHSLNFGWYEPLTDYLRYDASVGYSYDRLTKAKGPAWQIGLVYEPLADLETGLRLQGSVSSSNGVAGRTESFSWYLRFRF